MMNLAGASDKLQKIGLFLFLFFHVHSEDCQQDMMDDLRFEQVWMDTPVLVFSLTQSHAEK